jgi:hypothetical protein
MILGANRCFCSSVFQQRGQREAHAERERADRWTLERLHLFGHYPVMCCGEPAAAIYLGMLQAHEPGCGQLTLHRDATFDEGLVAVGGAGNDVDAIVISIRVAPLEMVYEPTTHSATKLLDVLHANLRSRKIGDYFSSHNFMSRWRSAVVFLGANEPTNMTTNSSISGLGPK